MKQLLFLLAFLPIFSFGCVIAPKQLDVSELNGFEYLKEPAKGYESVTEIRIVAPLKYQGKQFDLGVFSIHQNGVLVAKSIHSSVNESGMPEFLGYVSNKPGFSYSVTFLYGKGPCKSYEFTASSSQS